MDWNWFFSSVAQSAAAIVGIFAAFIITKILGNQSTFNSKCVLLDTFIADSKALEDEAGNRYFDWYNKRKLEIELEKLEEEFLDSESLLTPEEYYENFNFPEFLTKAEVLEAIEEKCQQRRATLEKERAAVRAQLEKLGLGSAVLSHKQMYVPKLMSFSEKVNEERELIDKLIVKIKHNCRHIENFLTTNRCHPESSSLITVSLILSVLLFFSGVIYPLSFLPLLTNSTLEIEASAFWEILWSLKGLILVIVSISFSIILSVFFVINLRLRYPSSKILELSKYSKISYYSKYLKNMVDNELSS